MKKRKKEKSNGIILLSHWRVILFALIEQIYSKANHNTFIQILWHPLPTLKLGKIVWGINIQHAQIYQP
jgi:hypothetical protein